MSNYYNYVNCCNRSYAEPYLLNKVSNKFPKNTDCRTICDNERDRYQKSCRDHIKKLNNEIVKLKVELKKISDTCIKPQNLNNIKLNTQPLPKIYQQNLAEESVPDWNTPNNLYSRNDQNIITLDNHDDENGSIPVWQNYINNNFNQYMQQY